MPIHIKCAACSAVYKVTDSQAGMNVKCPSCSATISVPVPAADEDDLVQMVLVEEHAPRTTPKTSKSQPRGLAFELIGDGETNWFQRFVFGNRWIEAERARWATERPYTWGERFIAICGTARLLTILGFFLGIPVALILVAIGGKPLAPVQNETLGFLLTPLVIAAGVPLGFTVVLLIIGLLAMPVIAVTFVATKIEGALEATPAGRRVLIVCSHCVGAFVFLMWCWIPILGALVGAGIALTVTDNPAVAVGGAAAGAAVLGFAKGVSFALEHSADGRRERAEYRAKLRSAK